MSKCRVDSFLNYLPRQCAFLYAACRREVTAKFCVELLSQSTYSTDFAPSDILFPDVNKDLKGKLFDTIPVIQTSLTNYLNSFVREDFQRAYKQWKKRWEWCIDTQGSYFKGF